MNVNLASEDLRTLTRVDIESDSVIDIIDKLFARATDGKTIDYASDTPMPNAVNPLLDSEVIEWGESAMKIRFQRVSSRPKRLGERIVSKLARFSQRSTASPFYGYKSTPPVADGFIADEPIGPAAKALKAAGVLTAVAKTQGEETTSFFDLYKQTWGPITEATAAYVTPNLVTTSGKDIVKFIRSSTHCLYGFNSDAPTVTIDLGRYRPETMVNNYQFDWHAMSLALRFIGEFIVRYKKPRIKTDAVLYMAPSYAEGKIYRMANLGVVKNVAITSNVCESVKKIAENTIKYYEGCITAYGVASKVRSTNRNISVIADEEVTVSMLRALERNMASVKVKLPKDVGKYVERRDIAEISDKKKKSFRETLSSIVNARKTSYIPTWRSIHTLVWAAAFKSGFPGVLQVMSALRQKALLAAMNEDEVYALTRSISMNAPKGIGHSIMTILLHMTPTKDRASVEFAEMIMCLSGSKELSLTSSYEMMYTTAIATTKDPVALLKALQAGFNRASDESHSATAFKREIMTAGDVHIKIVDALRSFMVDRLAYWSRHYGSRAIDCQSSLRAYKEELKVRKTATKTLAKLGKTMALDHVDVRMSGAVKDMSNDVIDSEVDDLKRKSVMYSFLAIGYTRATVIFDETHKASVMIREGDLRDILKRSTTNYARKRESWGDKLKVAAVEWREAVTKLDSLTRCSDMVKHCDEHFDPVVKWAWLYSNLLGKFAISSKATTKMLQTHVFPNLKTPEGYIQEEHIEMGEPMVINDAIDKYETAVRRDGYYSVLYYSSDSESDDVESLDGVPLENLGEEVDWRKPIEESYKDPKTVKELSTNKCDNIELGLEHGPSTNEVISLEKGEQHIARPEPEACQSDEDFLFGFEDFEVDDAMTKSEFSLKEYIRSKDGIYFNEWKYEEFISEKGVVSGDMLVELIELERLALDYQIFSSNDGLSSEMVTAIKESGNSTDIG